MEEQPQAAQPPADPAPPPKPAKVFRKQPILCPWITAQPYYHSSLWAKNRTDPAPSIAASRFVTNPWGNKAAGGATGGKNHEKSAPTIQQSSSEFFYFLRLMQLFPDTHPATLHTVLALCKNDFFCAVDKLLYAKRCKLMCYKKNLVKKGAVAGTASSGTRKCICKEGAVRGEKLMQEVAIVGGETALSLNLTTGGCGLEEGKRGASIQLQEAPISTFSENAEDLSTIKQSALETQNQAKTTKTKMV